MKRSAVLGGGGFIGNHLVTYLTNRGHYVLAVDLKTPNFSTSQSQDYFIGDLRDQNFVESLDLDTYDEVYQLAADMGGAGYIFSGNHDADIVHNSVSINLNVVEAVKNSNTKVFFASSACIYPQENQSDTNNPVCTEESAYPANPDSEYGWEKLFSERLYLSYARNYGLDVRIGRFHNIFGPEGAYTGGKEKAPAALCRKVAEAKDGDSIEVWGKGNQTRSFLYIDECLEGVERLMKSEYRLPLNIGSDEMISINDLAQLAIDISNKRLSIKNVDGLVGVNGRSSDNRLIQKELNWQPQYSLRKGIEKLYEWVDRQVNQV